MSPFRSTTALFILLAAPAMLSAQADPTLSRFIHPNAKALISIDWKHVRQSNVGATIREKWLNTGADAATAIPGIEFLNDVDRFLISSSGRKSSDDTSEDTPLLIVACGHFDLAKVRSVLTKFGAKAQMFNSITVYRPQGENGKDMAVVLLDAQTILIGDAASVFASVERSAFPPPAQDPNSIVARAAEMESNYDAWIIMTDPEEVANNRFVDRFSAGELGAGALGFDAGVSLRSGLAADVAVRFETESAAKNLASEMDKLLKLAAKGKAGDPALIDLGKKLKLTSEGSVAKFSLRLTPQELEKNTQVLASFQRQPAAAGTMANIQPLVGTTPAPPPQEEKKVIRIEGLDDGPRVIPYERQ
jgi:hypothetical protein